MSRRMPKRYEAPVRTENTDRGVHFWLGWLGCDRKAWLKELKRAHQEPGRLSGIVYFDIGSIFHALLALYYSLPPRDGLALDTGRVRYTTSAGPLETDLYIEAISEAERLFRGYRAFWGAADLGCIISIEEEYRAKLSGTDETVSGGVDLVCKLGKRDLKRLNLDGEPGIYPVDHKTRGRVDPMEYELATHDAQFSTYPKLVEAYGDEIKGFIVNLAFKGARPTFQRMLIPRMALDAEWPSTRNALVMATERRANALKVIEAGGLPQPNITSCFKKSSVGWDLCEFYKDGSCDRKPRSPHYTRKATT